MPADLLTFLPAGMTWEMMAVYGFLTGVILLFAFDVVRVDMVGLLVIVLLPLSGLVTPPEAISGLSSNAVVSIIAVMIIGHGLDKTGVMNQVAARIIRLSGKSRNRMMTLVAGTVAVISGFMQNIGAAALPAAERARVPGAYSHGICCGHRRVHHPGGVQSSDSAQRPGRIMVACQPGSGGPSTLFPVFPVLCGPHGHRPSGGGPGLFHFSGEMGAAEIRTGFRCLQPVEP
jgi:hypothetical protein